LDNCFHLAINPCLLLQDGIEIVGLVNPLLRTDEFDLDDVVKDLLQRLTVFFLHGKEEKRHHDEDHDHGCDRGRQHGAEKKKGRNTNKDAQPEADDLTFGQIEEEFGFDL